MLEVNRIYNADCLDILKQLPDKCIDLVVTSPPYDNLRTYNGTLEWSFVIFQDIAKELSRVLKPKGKLSIVKHNLYGRALSYAVLNDEPRSALDLLNNNFDNEKNMFGNRDTYSNEYLINLLADKMMLTDTFGIRTFFGLSANSEIKYSNEWYQSMLELEMKVSELTSFDNVQGVVKDLGLAYNKDNIVIIDE